MGTSAFRDSPRRLFLGIFWLLYVLSFPKSGFSQACPGDIVPGAQRTELWLPLLEGKRVGVIGNQTSLVKGDTLLPEYLLAKDVQVVRLFSPEHGFRGEADAGEEVGSGRDPVSGLPVISLYGAKKKPSHEDLRGIEVLIFDLQDVGTRFYTYVSTMHYAMEAAAENGIPIVVLDRPNPNDFVDGPLLEADCKSFIGMHPIPILHGLTVGELALMINGEGWLSGGRRCHLSVIPVKGWTHGQPYSLPIPPSPNLRSDGAVRLYPSLCLFEATVMSVGRGTENPFTCVGYPDRRFGDFSFVPQPGVGDKNPKHRGKRCFGERFDSDKLVKGFELSIFLQYFRLAERLGYSLVDRKRTFELLIGNKRLLGQIERGDSEEVITKRWEKDLKKYRELRKKYLIYPDYPTSSFGDGK